MRGVSVWRVGGVESGGVMVCFICTELVEEKRSQVVQEIEEFDRSLLVAVETVFKDKLPSADSETRTMAVCVHVASPPL